MSRRIVANNTLLDEAVKALGEGSEVQIPTKGSSMFPFIVGGQDTLILEPIREIGVGDIVLAKYREHYIVHRIIEIDQRSSQVTLMGDGNIRGRELCKVGNLCAKAKYIVHRGIAVDCNSRRSRRQATTWRMLLPLRRYILGIWRRTPFWPF